MTRKTLQQMKTERLASVGVDERAEFDETYAAVRLALEFGEKVRDAREAAGLSQRELAVRMGTSQAAVARLEAGGVGSTLTTLQRVADALGMAISVDLELAG
ncbi:MAG: ribosome-binding protein aMBF1 (putative translation factor) [Acidimicrobiales bacterium]|jgi:ribosome-binding protein aMBF1 (putative translation factor)